MHSHLGALDIVKTFMAVIIVGTIWRLIAAYNSQNGLGQAMSFIY